MIKDKISGILDPIFQDIQSTMLWAGGAVAVIALMIAFLKWYNAEDANERKAPIKWMRIIVIGYLGLHIVVWFVNTYLSSKV